MAPVAIALGSSIGDRAAHLDYAASRLRMLLDNVVISSYRETAPVDVPGPAPLFLNAAAVGETARSPREVLKALLDIERDRRRQRPFRHAPRTLDLDLVLYADAVIDEPDLVVPHPRFRERRFVLEPLAEIAPQWLDPVSGRSISELLRRLTG